MLGREDEEEEEDEDEEEEKEGGISCLGDISIGAEPEGLPP